ncbi:MAG: HEAT repeat domain-containing protein [Polyangia bacterium]|jgi:HEAT repeat protein|nr:HEAT repeat domain-containing protein [Polyangia bacterium]
MSPAPSGSIDAQARAPACIDPQLERAFEALAACDYKAGVIDFQCPAWKGLHEVLTDRELENQALVQLTLLKLLGHKEERVRLAVAKSLSSYARQRSVVRGLGEALGKEKSPEVRAWIVFSMHSSSPEAKTFVLGALKEDGSSLVRAKAAQRLNLAHFGKDKDVRAALLHALRNDSAEEVRKRAAESLGHAHGDVETEKVLLDCLADPALGPHCGIGLARLGTQAGYQAILGLVKKGAEQRTLHPLQLLNLADYTRSPFFSAAAVRPVIVSVARDERIGLGARHYAVRALGRLGRDLQGERAASLAVLRALARDKILGSYARGELEQLEQAGRQAAGGR